MIDRLEVPVQGGGFAPFAAWDRDAAAVRAAEDDAVGVIRERRNDGRIGRTWRVSLNRARLNDERRIEEVAA